MRRINLHSPPSFDVAANRPDHPLHRLDRPLDNPITLCTANWTVLDDHP